MARSDWNHYHFFSSGASLNGEPRAHSALSSPLTGHGTQFATSDSNQTQGWAAECTDAITTDIPWATSTFVSAFMRLSQDPGGNSHVCLWLSSHGIDGISASSDGTGGYGYCVRIASTTNGAGLHLHDHFGSLTPRLEFLAYKDRSNYPTERVNLISLDDVWTRVRMRRIVVDNDNVQIIVDTAPAGDEDNWTERLNQTYTAGDAGFINNYTVTPDSAERNAQACMGFSIFKNSSQTAGIDYWQGGTL